MSRTYRRSSWTDENSIVQHINRDLAYHNRRPYKDISVKRTKEEIDEENARRWKEYEVDCRLYAKRMGISIDAAKSAKKRFVSFIGREYFTPVIPLPTPCFSKKSVRVEMSDEEVIEEAIRAYKKHHRDGHWNETSRNKYFKYLAKHEVRNEWKKAKQKILQSEDYDYDRPYPGNYSGKKHFWSVW